MSPAVWRDHTINVWIIVTGQSYPLLAGLDQILREYERGVVFRLGRVLSAKGAGNRPGSRADSPPACIRQRRWSASKLRRQDVSDR
jgi:hypothetical protein